MSFRLSGTLTGHNGRITSLAVAPNNPQVLLSGSRDKTVVVWHLQPQENNEAGYAHKSLVGHSHFVESVVVSSDGQVFFFFV